MTRFVARQGHLEPSRPAIATRDGLHLGDRMVDLGGGDHLETLNPNPDHVWSETVYNYNAASTSCSTGFLNTKYRPLPTPGFPCAVPQ